MGLDSETGSEPINPKFRGLQAQTNHRVVILRSRLSILSFPLFIDYRIHCGRGIFTHFQIPNRFLADYCHLLSFALPLTATAPGARQNQCLRSIQPGASRVRPFQLIYHILPLSRVDPANYLSPYHTFNRTSIPPFHAILQLIPISLMNTRPSV